MKKYIFIFLFIVVGCAGGSGGNGENGENVVIEHEKVVSYPVEFESKITDYKSFLAAYDWPPLDDIIIELVDDADLVLNYSYLNVGTVKGVCIKESNRTPKILISESNWNSISIADENKWAAFLHYMGLCSLGKTQNLNTYKYTFNFIDYQVPESFMHPDFRVNHWPAGHFDAFKFTGYLNEFFTKLN